MFYKNLEVKYQVTGKIQSLKCFVMKTKLEYCYCLHMCSVDISFNQMVFVECITYDPIESVCLVFHE